jgi:hypothetical protein
MLGTSVASHWAKVVGKNSSTDWGLCQECLEEVERFNPNTQTPADAKRLADAPEVDTKKRGIRQDQPMIFEAGTLVPEAGRYECKTCGVTNLTGGLFAALSSLKPDTNTDNLHAQLQAKLKEPGRVKIFKRGETFAQCPRCGKLTAWQLLENTDSAAGNTAAIRQEPGYAITEKPLPGPFPVPVVDIRVARDASTGGTRKWWQFWK